MRCGSATSPMMPTQGYWPARCSRRPAATRSKSGPVGGWLRGWSARPCRPERRLSVKALAPLSPRAGLFFRPDGAALFQLRKILFPEFERAALRRLARFGFALAELHAADLARDGLGQLGEF